jgi:hypothetical protein
VRVTTPFTLKDDLRNTLRERGAVAGNTWGSFIDAMAALGVRRDDLLASIEFKVSTFGSGRLVIEQNEDGEGWEVREKRG